MAEDRRSSDAQVSALGAQIRELQRRLDRVERRESELMRAVDAMRAEVRADVQHLQQVIAADRAYIRGSLDRVNTVLGQISANEARVSGAVSVMRLAWKLLGIAAGLLGITAVLVRGWVQVLFAWLRG